MIQQRPGDVLEIYFEKKWYYLVVITKIIMFGGNVVYAFHGNGEKIDRFIANPNIPGFNICTDLLMPKKEGVVNRIGKIDDLKNYILSKYIKGCNEYRPGCKAEEWWISTIENPSDDIARVKSLSKEHAMAMDDGVFSFDLTAQKILTGYTPDQNPFI